MVGHISNREKYTLSAMTTMQSIFISRCKALSEYDLDAILTALAVGDVATLQHIWQWLTADLNNDPHCSDHVVTVKRIK